MQDVFRGDGLAPDAAFGKGQVFGDASVQVVAFTTWYRMPVAGSISSPSGGAGGTVTVIESGDVSDASASSASSSTYSQ